MINVTNNSSIKFYVSDNPDKFQKLGSKFLNNAIDSINLIQL